MKGDVFGNLLRVVGAVAIGVGGGLEASYWSTALVERELAMTRTGTDITVDGDGGQVSGVEITDAECDTRLGLIRAWVGVKFPHGLVSEPRGLDPDAGYEGRVVLVGSDGSEKVLKYVKVSPDPLCEMKGPIRVMLERAAGIR